MVPHAAAVGRAAILHFGSSPQQRGCLGGRACGCRGRGGSAPERASDTCLHRMLTRSPDPELGDTFAEGGQVCHEKGRGRACAQVCPAPLLCTAPPAVFSAARGREGDHGQQSGSAGRARPAGPGAESRERRGGEDRGGAGGGARPRPRWAGPGEDRGLTGCSMTLSTVRLMSAMASVYTAASSWISLWFWGRRAR